MWTSLFIQHADVTSSWTKGLCQNPAIMSTSGGKWRCRRTILEMGGHYVDIGDARLYVVERGSGYPLLVFHGGPGIDHHSFGDYLDALADEYRLILVDQRSNGRSDRTPEETWTPKSRWPQMSVL